MKKELIGLKARILFNNREFTGTIINETKNMLYLQTENNQIKKFIKKNTEIHTKNNKIMGKDIIKRPEDRIKM
jgi:RNase P/RNase MRP subunit p29